MLKLYILLTVPLVASGFFIHGDPSKWNGLEVTWRVFGGFDNLPRSKGEAMHDGWVSMNGTTTMMGGGTTDVAACESNVHFKGERFFKNHDMGVILLFSTSGHIAGIQIGFPANYSRNPNHFPFKRLINAPMVLDKGDYFLTAYFMAPADVCKNQGKTHVDGTGTGLWIQNGSNPVRDSIKMPSTKAEADKTMWTEGSCFPTMGLHYWYNLRENMPCDEFFPVFLLYNGGVLNAFGWAMAIDLSGISSRVENPPQSSYSRFMKTPPTCLHNLGTLSTLHIYLTNHARIVDWC